MRATLMTIPVCLLLAAVTGRAATPPPTSDAVAAQIAALQQQLAVLREAEARKALADEAAATAKADAARQYLTSIGKPAPDLTETAAQIAAAAEAAKEKNAVTTVTKKADGTKETKVEPFSPTSMRDDGDGKMKFGGIDFGIGLAFSYDLGTNDRVREATLVNGVIRVSQSDNVRARLILESHYMFTPDDILGISNIFGLNNSDKEPEEKEWGVGPFVAIQPGTDNVIDAIGAGLMFGFRRSPKSRDSFNIGIGVLYDIDSRILGEGLVANRPLPAGETEIRYKTQEQSGLLLMTSYSF